MKYLVPILFALTITTVACKKQPPQLTYAAGTIQRQGATTYQYGSHLLVVDANKQLVLSSKTVKLDNYVGKRVIISAVRNDNTVENGPTLYKVLSARQIP